MTERDAIEKATEFVRANVQGLGNIVNARYLDSNWFRQNSTNCPPELLDTFHSVQSTFRSHWIVTFEVESEEGIVDCPSTRQIRVFDSGLIEVAPE